MRKICTLLTLVALPLGAAHAQTTPAVRSLLLDFGPNDSTNGNITPSPDANGSYWNNILNNTGVADTFRLVDKANAATGVKVKVGANFLTNGIATGGLLAPAAALLGEYAIATATQDYFFVQGTGSTAIGTLRFSGLDKSKRYVFQLFGSRQTTAEMRVSQYKLTGTNVSTVTQTTTGTNVGANGYAGNNTTITKSDTLTADAAGGITLELSKITGSYAYLNLLRLDIVPGRAGSTAPPVYTSFQNPGFELGSLAYWTTGGGGTAPGASVSQAKAHTGSYAAKLTAASLSLTQQISYAAQTGVGTYRLNGWFYNASADALHGTQAGYLELLYYDATSALLGRFRSDSVTANTTPDTWVRLSAVGAVPAGTAFVRAAAVWRNAAGATGSVYFDDLALEPYVALNPNKLTYIGSSVPYGTGATNNHGYTYLYADLLAARAAAGVSGPWVTANVCVPGNSTVDVTNRFDSDVFPQNGKYVFIGLSLGNENIIGAGQAAFNQFRDNMVALIKHARANGLVPIISNNYGRNDFGPTEYAYVKQMNALIHGWNVPSANLLGAVDDLAGHYAPGYWYDALHPNDLGHAEMARAIVPSLLDALAAGKTLPTRRPSAANPGLALRNAATAPAPTVRLTPEAVVHPFTAALRFRTAGPGRLLLVADSAGLASGTVAVAANGKLLYTSAKGRTIAGTKTVSDNRWHKLVLTHYYARGATQLYVDSTFEGTAAERLRPTRLDLGGNAAPARVQLREFLFYRAGMNEGEVQTLAADSLLKSSLEIYAPLDGSRTVAADSLANLAQSLNTLSRTASALATRASAEAAAISFYPNPGSGALYVQSPRSLEGTVVQLRDALGRAVLTTPVRQGRLELGALPAGVYLLQFQLGDELVTKRLVRLVN